MNKLFKGLLCLAILSFTLISIGKQSASSANNHYKFVTEGKIWQTDPILREYAKHQLKKKNPISKEGATGNNIQKPSDVQVGWQRSGFDIISYGVAINDPAIIEEGIRTFKWAFEKQSADGSFGISRYPEVITFLGAYSHSILLLRDSGYKDQAKILMDYLPKMKKYLDKPEMIEWEKKFEETETRNILTNQLFWAANSYHFIHLVQKNPRLEEKARLWIKRGLDRQTEDGIFPEKKGGDTSYQGVSLQFLCLYSLYSNSSDRRALQPYLVSGFNWLSEKVLPDGTIDVSENTRTGKNQEKSASGKYKGGKYGKPTPYIFWSYLGGGNKARETAELILEAPHSRSK